LLIEFPDQRPGSEAGWDPVLLHPANAAQFRRDITGLRKRISLRARQFMGARLHRYGVRTYDRIYGLLMSDRSLAARQKARQFFGEAFERIVSRAFYGIFLTKPPTRRDIVAWKERMSFPDGPPPLFIKHRDGDKINILVATAWLNIGGVEQYVLNLCRGLDRSRFRVIVATTKASRHPSEALFREAGVHIYHLSEILGPASISEGLSHLAFNLDIHCLHIIHSREAYEASRRLKSVAPWLTIIDRLEVFEEGGFPEFSAKIGADAVDVRTVSHKRLAEVMAHKYRLSKQRLRVIYAGTDMARVDAALARKQGVLRALCKLPDEIPIVVFVGRLTAQKRPDIFVRTAAKIMEIDPNCAAHFALVGDGEMKASVERCVREQLLQGRVHLLGAHQNALDLMADATLLMMPSAYEGLAFVSYEAMALGLPQIFANVNGQSELITPETGILIDNGPDEEERYARACLSLLADPVRRARMKAAGQERVRASFTVAQAIKRYSELFEELAELSRRRSAETPHLRPPHIDPLYHFADGEKK
jgi:glycosyltransferase involved in cell wall biosynthesis